MNKRIEDIIAETRLNEILHKNEAEKQKNTVIWTLAIIGAVAAVAAIAYAVYRFVSPDYLDDFEDDFDDGKPPNAVTRTTMNMIIDIMVLIPPP